MARYRLAGLLSVLVSISAWANPQALTGHSLFRNVERFAGFGDHRTGTAADEATVQWLMKELQTAGFQVERQSFELQQFFPAEQSLLIRGKALPVFPHWYPNSSDAPIAAVMAPFGSSDLNGKIAYLAPDQAGPWHQVRPGILAAQAAAKGAHALVIAVPHPSGEIYAINAAAPHLQQPVMIPTVAIAAQHHASIAPALAGQEAVQLISRGEHRATAAANVIARYPSTPIAGAPSVIISTPISCWFQCAGERGTGVALWLELAQYIVKRETGLNWLFVANSGHELSFMGAHKSLPSMPEPGAVRLWLHLGASIAARRWREQDGRLIPLEEGHEYNRLYASERLLATAREVFSGIPRLDILRNEELNAAQSELAAIAGKGYAAFGFVGSHRFFHTPLDTPAVTSPALLAPYGDALRRLVDRLATPSDIQKGAS